MRWDRMTWPEVRAVVERSPFALLPIGAIEEHGPHLPLSTDNDVTRALANDVAERAKLVTLPLLPYGQVWSLEHFDGSLSVQEDTLVQLVVDLALGLQRNGVRGIVLFSAHIGNAAPMKRAVRRLAAEHGFPALALCYPGLDEIARQVRESPESRRGFMHADEIETSIMLAVAPDLVRMERAVREYPVYPEHTEAASVRWDGFSSSGVFGDATAATAEKGDRVAGHVVDAAVRLVESWKDASA